MPVSRPVLLSPRDLDTAATSTVTLVYAHDFDGGTNRVSILAPAGAALIGPKKKESIERPLPADRRRLGVVSVVVP